MYQEDMADAVSFLFGVIEVSKSRNKQQYDWFYRKPAWRKCRMIALERDNHLCQHCLEKHDIFTPADVVHHIVYVETDFTLALQLDNLISLCHACHNKVHEEDEKRFGNTKKAKRQRMIESKKIKVVKL